jgi:hypothetical protein
VADCDGMALAGTVMTDCDGMWIQCEVCVMTDRRGMYTYVSGMYDGVCVMTDRLCMCIRCEVCGATMCIYMRHVLSLTAEERRLGCDVTPGVLHDTQR